MISKEKGDLALAHAIRHYIAAGYEVCLPIGDKQKYDLLIEEGGKISRVQVKYGGLYPGRSGCRVALRVMGGNQSFNYAKKYADDAFDILFVHTAKGDDYSIPWRAIRPRSELCIETDKYQVYLVNNPSRVTQAANGG